MAQFKITLTKRTPELEFYILKDPTLFIEYTKKIIKKRWKEAEKVILENKDAESAIEYIRDILKDSPWPEAESFLIKEDWAVHYYARFVMKKRWIEGEKVVVNSTWSIHYASDVMYARWPEAEQYLLNEAKKYIDTGKTPNEWTRPVDDLLHYIQFVIKDKWPEAEQYLITNARCAYSYAKDILKTRWKEAEKIILKDETFGPFYANDFLDKRILSQ